MDEILNILNRYSSKMGEYEDENILFEHIVSLKGNIDKLHKIEQEIEGNGLLGSIRILRYTLAKKLEFEEEDIKNPKNIKAVIEEIKDKFNKNEFKYFEKYLKDNDRALEYVKEYKCKQQNAFRNWGAYYSYLLPFIYSFEDREKVWNCLSILIKNILKSLNLEKEYECEITPFRWGKKVKSYYGFEGPSNYGTLHSSLMIHPKAIEDHKNAIQFACTFYKGEIFAGYDTGWNISDDDFKRLGLPNRESKEKAETYNKLIGRLKDVKNIVITSNNKLIRANAIVTRKVIIERNAEEENDKEETVNLFDVSKEGKFEQKSDKIVYTGLARHIGPNEDYLGRNKYAEFIAGVIKAKINEPPLSIGILAPWGEGKTQLINLVKENLKKEKLKTPFLNLKNEKSDEEYEISHFIDFDAWRYNDEEHIWAALIMEFMKKCDKNFVFYLKFLFWKFKKAICYENLLKFGFFAFLFAFLLPYCISNNAIVNLLQLHPFIFALAVVCFYDALKISKLTVSDEFLKCLKTPSYSKHLGFKNEISDLIDLTLSHLTKNGDKRAVLVIDNLDRCSKENIVNTLDCISQFLTICANGKSHNIATIFAIDYSIIKNAVKNKLISSCEECIDIDKKADEYLEKIIQITFDIPKTKDLDTFLQECVDKEHEDIISFVKEYIIKNTQLTPRTIRRLINQLILLKNHKNEDEICSMLDNFCESLSKRCNFSKDEIKEGLIKFNIAPDTKEVFF